VPALAQQLGVSPQDFETSIAARSPAVGAGLGQLLEILRYFDGVQNTMAAQQQDFDQADAIPTKSLPNTTVPWLFVSLGVSAIALGVAGLLGRTRLLTVGTAVLGIVVVATTLLLSVPAKTASVDDLTAAFRPIFTEQGAAQARGYVGTLQAMERQLTTEALPDMAAQLGLTTDQLVTTVATSVPSVATGLQQLPQILARADALVTVVEANVHNFALADSLPTGGLPTTSITWQLMVPASLLIVGGAAGAVTRTRRRVGVAVESATPESALAA
jgi:hypothetical protein